MLSRVQTQIHTEGALHMLARQNFFILLDTVSTLYREKNYKQTNKKYEISYRRDILLSFVWLFKLTQIYFYFNLQSVI